MGIYLPNIEIPTNGHITITISDNGEIVCDSEVIGGKYQYRSYGRVGKAIPVLSHERLIDANALMLEIQEYIEEYGWETDEHGWHNEKWCAMKEAAMVIDAAPTIIPAEPPKEE